MRSSRTSTVGRSIRNRSSKPYRWSTQPAEPATFVGVVAARLLQVVGIREYLHSRGLATYQPSGHSHELEFTVDLTKDRTEARPVLIDERPGIDDADRDLDHRETLALRRSIRLPCSTPGSAIPQSSGPSRMRHDRALVPVTSWRPAARWRLPLSTLVRPATKTAILVSLRVCAP